jgi:hypothetical protein
LNVCHKLPPPASHALRCAADDKDNAALYVRFMKKAAEKGVEWIAAETERLTKMSEKPMSGGDLGCGTIWWFLKPHLFCCVPA